MYGRIFLIGLLVMLLLLVPIGCNIPGGTGKKIGQVVQLGSHGMFCSTTEGKLVRGGFNTGSGSSGGVLDFSVRSDDKKLIEGLQAAMEKQQEIEVTYQILQFVGPCTGDTGYFITSFRILSDTTPTIEVKPAVTQDRERKRQELLKKLQDLDTQ